MIVIEPKSPTPPFEQLRRQIAAMIDTEQLPPGSKLPPVRRLAEDLGLAPNTVARAYRELEQAELIETRGRHGTSIRSRGSSLSAAAQLAVQDFARRMRELEVSSPDAVAAVQAALASVHHDRAVAS